MGLNRRWVIFTDVAAPDAVGDAWLILKTKFQGSSKVITVKLQYVHEKTMNLCRTSYQELVEL